MRRSFRRTFFGIGVFVAIPLVVACGDKKKPYIVDAGLVATAPPVDATVILDEIDAADAADAADAHKKVGVGVNTNVARLRQCCGQLRVQAKALGVSPEAAALTQAAAQCDGIAAQAAPGANAPELGILRT